MKETKNFQGDISRFINAVIEYADNVLERCYDMYGAKQTPLLIDGISIDTGKPTMWEKYVLSNLACQQNFLRTLNGLTALTEIPGYQDIAYEWISYAMNELQDSESGMLYWGGHTSYDLIENKPLLGNHELKCVYPYYSYLYEVAPEATTFLIEGIWNKHIKDWSNLLFNRHGEYAAWDRATAWKHDYSGSPLPIVENSMLSFINTGSDLIYSATLLTKLSGKNEPLEWAERLVHRYEEIRHEVTGLGGYQFNHRDPCRVRISFKKPLSERQDVNETTVITSGVIQTRYGRAALTFMNLFEELDASDGQMFLDFVCSDLKALGKYAYDFSDHSFSSILNDGMKLSPSDSMEGVGYCGPRKLEKVSANGVMFYAYTRAYCLSGDTYLWQIARSLAQGIGLQEIFEATSDQSAQLQSDLSDISAPLSQTSIQNHACTLLALIELYKTTKQQGYLSLAVDLGNKLIQEYFVNGFFTTGAETSTGYTSIDNHLPVALLHLAVAAQGVDIDIPTFYPNSTSFDPKVIIARRKRS